MSLQKLKENLIATAKSLVDTNLPGTEYGDRLWVDTGLFYTLLVLSQTTDIHPTILTTAALVFIGEAAKNFVLEGKDYQVGTSNRLQNPQQSRWIT